ncbi:fatty acid hydroxylase [Alicycliphilus sp. B1]|nr:fatty acid hydroxylase [Alicycliphilus sp. B1]
MYLTFDTGHMGVAPLVAEVLQRQRVQVTFFAADERTQSGGSSLDEQWAPWWRARAAEGHEFASHTLHHVYWRADEGAGLKVRPSTGPQAGKDLSMTAEQYCAEIDGAANRLRAMTGKEPLPLFRAPGGKTSPRLLEAAQSCGYMHVGWTPAGFLGDELPSERYANRMLLEQALRTIRDGDILLAHLGIWSRKDPGRRPCWSLDQGPEGAWAVLSHPARTPRLRDEGPEQEVTRPATMLGVDERDAMVNSMSLPSQLFDAAQQWLFEAVVQPALFALGLANVLEDAYVATGWLLVGLLQLLVMLALIGPLERWRPVEPLQDRAAVRVDVIYTLIHRLGLFRLALFFMAEPLWDGLFGMLRTHGWRTFQLDALWPGVTDQPLASLLLYLLVFDFVDYWIHRGQHRFGWWWRLHALHHSQRQMTMWSDSRNHLLDDLLRDAIIVVVAQCIGVAPGQFVAIVALTPAQREPAPCQPAPVVRPPGRAPVGQSALSPPASRHRHRA